MAVKVEAREDLFRPGGDETMVGFGKLKMANPHRDRGHIQVRKSNGDGLNGEEELGRWRWKGARDRAASERILERCDACVRRKLHHLKRARRSFRSLRWLQPVESEVVSPRPAVATICSVGLPSNHVYVHEI